MIFINRATYYVILYDITMIEKFYFNNDIFKICIELQIFVVLEPNL
jgi:hypothetical protein